MSGTDLKDMTPDQLAAKIKADHDKATDAVKEIAESALGKAESGEAMSSAAKEKADEALIKMNELKTQLTNLEQKMAAGGDAGDPDRGKSLGQRFVDDEAVKAFMDAQATSGKVKMQTKATITSLTTDAAGSAGAAVDPMRIPGIKGPGQRRLFVRDVIAPGTMDSGSVEFVQETGFTNNAGMRAETGAAAQSDIKLALLNQPARSIAHTMKASRIILEDAPQTASYLDQRGMYGLMVKEDQQLLTGDGTGQNFTGLNVSAAAYDNSHEVAGSTALDKLRYAVLQVTLAEFGASAHILNPIDAARIELTKDADGNYLIARPEGTGILSLWRLPVVETQAQTIDTFLTGSFDMGAQFFERRAAAVEVGYENDDFTKGLVTLMIEERAALATYRPEAFVSGDLGFVA